MESSAAAMRDVEDRLESGNLRDVYRAALLDAESIANETYEAPHRDHDEKRHDAPDHEVLAFLDAVSAAEDSLHEAVEEGEEREGYDDREGDVDEPGDRAQEGLEVAEVLGEGERRSEGQGRDDKLFHSV